MTTLQWKRQPGRWSWVLTHDFEIELPRPAHGAFRCEYREFHCATIIRDRLILKAGYAIDGATGGPTWESFLPGIFVHDLFCQFYHNLLFRTKVGDRSEGDRLFGLLLRQHARWPERVAIPVFVAAVRLYGVTRPPKHDPDLCVLRLCS